MPKILLSLFVSKLLENQRKPKFGNSSFVLHFFIYQEVFFKSFSLCFLFQNTLYFSRLSYHSIPIFRILFVWENCLWSFENTKREFVIIGSPSCKLFLCFGFASYLMCRGYCVRERSCVLLMLSCNFSVEVPLWKSCMDIVKILLCEGRDVEQCLEPPNISRCLCLINYLSTLSLISCIVITYLYSYTC